MNHWISTCTCLSNNPPYIFFSFKLKNISALKQANNKVHPFKCYWNYWNFPQHQHIFWRSFSKLCTLWNSDRLANYRLQVQSSCSSCRTGTIWQRSPCPLALGSGRLACACMKSWSIRWPDPWTPVESATEADRPVPWINSSHPPYPPTTEIKICVCNFS